MANEANEDQGELHKKAMMDARNIGRGIAEPEIRSRYYDIANTITLAGPTNPGDADSNVYNQERVYDNIQKRGRKVWVANDDPAGGNTIFIRVSHDGMNTFSQETPIYPRQFKVLLNCYEVRLRSAVAGTPYRVTEYEIGAL